MKKGGRVRPLPGNLATTWTTVGPLRGIDIIFLGRVMVGTVETLSDARARCQAAFSLSSRFFLFVGRRPTVREVVAIAALWPRP